VNFSRHNSALGVRRPTLSFLATLAICALSAAIGAAGASADFGIAAFDAGSRADAGGTPYVQAGGHPYTSDTTIELNSHPNPDNPEIIAPDESAKDIAVDLPTGLIGNPASVGECTLSELVHSESDEVEKANGAGACPIDSVIGTSYVKLGSWELRFPLINMATDGTATTWAMNATRLIVLYEASVRPDGGITITSRNISEGVPFYGNKVVVWGTPFDSSHDPDRCTSSYGVFGAFLKDVCPAEPGTYRGPHSVNGAHVPYVTMPTRCTGSEGLPYHLFGDAWGDPLHLTTEADATAAGTTGCDVVPFTPTISTQPTLQRAESPSGLNVELKMPTEGLLNADGVSQSHIKKAVVTLPEGVTINPSQAEGLSTCSPAQYNQEQPRQTPGTGCPQSAKIGTVDVNTPVLTEPLKGNVYVAQPHNNPFDSLLALYIVIKAPDKGVVLKFAGEVTPDPVTAQIKTTFSDLPQAPIESFTLHFREGQRSPLATPRTCGTYTTNAVFTPWANPDTTVSTSSSFQITEGVGGGPCPSGGNPPFKPGLDAGTLNNAAGRYSPFNLRLTRNDGEQEFTHFSIKLPPGILGKLAGVPFCPDAAIAAAKAPARTGSQEEQSPSCPAASQVGRTLVGAGVGSVLVYAPGKVYLAGPYHGSALSIAAITAAKVGPFDLGTVVVRQALKINPETAEVFIDSVGSDPIPHIIDGIAVHARDIRAYVDRPEFVLNPTGCDRTSTASTVLGSGTDFGSEADDNPITVTSPFQAADCGALGFKPKLALNLLGGTKRGDNPKLRAVLTYPRGAYANIARAQVTLPHSEFLDNEHIKTICTRIQFKEGAVPGERCPAGSVYGYAKAITPLLDEPLAGPVFLRSSSHNLPDLVAALHSGKIDVNLTGRIDSVQGGRIRNTFEAVPDAPVSKFTLTMQGGKKSLLVNSTNLCKSTNRAIAAFTAHNGKVHNFNPVLRPKCAKHSKRRR
jgi:hypothetical protein